MVCRIFRSQSSLFPSNKSSKSLFFRLFLQKAIEQEKEKINFINNIEHFDPKNLKHTETVEKNPLPTKEVIEDEKQNA